MIAAFFIVAVVLYFSIMLALGFWILITAIKQERWLRILGLTSGWLIIVLAVVSVLISSVLGMAFWRYGLWTGPMHPTFRQDNAVRQVPPRDRFYCPHCPYSNYQNQEER